MSAGEGRTSEACGTTTAITCGRMEVGPHHDGFCFGIAKDHQREEFYLGHCGLSDEGSSFLGCEDDGPVDYPEQIVYRGDHETARSIFIYCLRSRSKICVPVLAEFAVGIGDATEVQYDISSTEQLAVGEGYPDS